MNDFKKYCLKSGDTELGLGWKEENEYGFCVWRIQDGRFLVVNVFGDGSFWNDWITEKARTLGYDRIMFMTKRSPKAFIKKYNYKVVGHILEKEV